VGVKEVGFCSLASPRDTSFWRGRLPQPEGRAAAIFAEARCTPPRISQENNMLKNTLSEIEARIESTSALKEEQKRELLSLLSTLKSEIAQLSRTHSEHAQSITGFTGLSTHEATRQEPNPELLKLSLEGLSTSVQGFETSHPRLVEIVNAISLMLSNSGV
jgi:hypothetical protein